MSNLNIFYMTKGNEEVLSNLPVMLEFQKIFLGGDDTGAITVIWATAEIARNPIIMKKAQEEIRSSVGHKGRATEERTDELQYLKMVIKETLRLHPPAPLLLPRETMSRCQINGYDIYLKTLIQVMLGQLEEILSTGEILKSSSLKDLLTAPLNIKDNVLSFCHLDLVQEFVLG
jgi:cytochrome P450